MGFRLDVLVDVVAVEHVRLERIELRVLEARVIELAPLAPEAGHARQRAADPAVALAAGDDDAVAIVVEAGGPALVERPEEGDGDPARRELGERVVSAGAFGLELRAGAQRREDHRLRGGDLGLVWETPEPVARVAHVDERLRSDADPRAAAGLVRAVEPGGRARIGSPRRNFSTTSRASAVG